jgi:hypothetical protein
VQRSIDRRDNPTRRRATLHATSTSVAATRGCPQLLASSEVMASFVGWAHCCHICAGTRLALPHLRRDSAHPCHICTGTAAASAPGLADGLLRALSQPLWPTHRRPTDRPLRRRSQCPPTAPFICQVRRRRAARQPRAARDGEAHVHPFVALSESLGALLRSGPLRSRSDRPCPCARVRVRARMRAHSLRLP